MAPSTPRAPRRLAPAQRREQLVRTAMALLAEGGVEALSFDAVAQRAGVTRNLLYHYFPGGIGDLVRAAADLAGQDLVAGWTTDPELTLAERRVRNFTAMVRHAGTPTDAWAVSRITSVSTDPAIRALNDRYRGEIVAAIALNALGTTEPAPLQRAALEAYLAFAEALLDRGRERGLPSDEVVGVLAAMLDATVRTSAGKNRGTAGV
jgi:AcrR family transcriptional regulator